MFLGWYCRQLNNWMYPIDRSPIGESELIFCYKLAQKESDVKKWSYTVDLDLYIQSIPENLIERNSNRIYSIQIQLQLKFMKFKSWESFLEVYCSIFIKILTFIWINTNTRSFTQSSLNIFPFNTLNSQIFKWGCHCSIWNKFTTNSIFPWFSDQHVRMRSNLGLK